MSGFFSIPILVTIQDLQLSMCKGVAGVCESRKTSEDRQEIVIILPTAGFGIWSSSNVSEASRLASDTRLLAL